MSKTNPVGHQTSISTFLRYYPLNGDGNPQQSFWLWFSENVFCSLTEAQNVVYIFFRNISFNPNNVKKMTPPEKYLIPYILGNILEMILILKEFKTDSKSVLFYLLQNQEEQFYPHPTPPPTPTDGIPNHWFLFCNFSGFVISRTYLLPSQVGK